MGNPRIIGIKLNGLDYDYEDEPLTPIVEENTEAIGNLNLLETTVKTDLVSAINEVNSGSSAVGDLENLTTDAKNNIVSAINEVDGHADDNADAIGTLANLTTTAKTDLVSAINEVKADANPATEVQTITGNGLTVRVDKKGNSALFSLFGATDNEIQGSYIFPNNLPVGFRPIRTFYTPLYNDDDILIQGYVMVSTNGLVQITIFNDATLTDGVTLIASMQTFVA